MPVMAATRHDVTYRQLCKREFQEIYMNKKAGLFIDCDITRRNITDIRKTDRASVTSFKA